MRHARFFRCVWLISWLRPCLILSGSLPPSPADSGVSDVDSSSSGHTSTDELKARLQPTPLPPSNGAGGPPGPQHSPLGAGSGGGYHHHQQFLAPYYHHQQHLHARHLHYGVQTNRQQCELPLILFLILTSKFY